MQLRGGFMFRSFFSFLIVTCFFEFGFAQEVKLTFEDLTKFVREKNQNVAGAVLLKDASQAKTGHLLRSYLPSVRAFTGQETFQTGIYPTQTQPYGGIEANINIFRGGKDLLEENIRKSQAKASAAGLQRSFSTELLEARRLYWRIVANREILKTLAVSQQQNEKSLAMANRRISRGLSTETDRLDFQIHKSQLNEDIESTTHQTLLLQISLSAILGMDTNTNYKTDDFIPHIHDKELINKKLETELNPDYVTFKSSQESSAAQYTQASRWWIPSLDVYSTTQLYTLRERDYLTQQDRIDSAVGARLSLEFDFYKVADASALSLQAKAYEKQAQQKSKSVVAEAMVAKEDLKHEHELIHFSEDRVEQGKKYFSRTLDEYNRGVKNSIDVLSAAQRYLSFQKEYSERRRNYQLTKSAVLFLSNEY